MENNKENVSKFKLKTRIPLPLKALTTSPKSHLKDNHKKQENSGNEQQRQPLKTINKRTDINKNSAGPSKSKNIAQRKPKINTQYVTMRRKNEELDWHYQVFKDESSSSVVSISDDEDLETSSNKEYEYFSKNHMKNYLGISKSLLDVTPSYKSLESKSIKNIKRSLKRPHSRELQGLSPCAKQEKRCLDDNEKRRLQFNERLQDRLQSPDYWKKSYTRCLNRDYTNDMFEYLIKTERKPLDIPRVYSITRACVINWLMKVNGADGNPAVVQSACWYFDSVLGTSDVKAEKLQLVAASCLWIAQKIHGPVFPAAKLIRCSNHAFTAETLLAAEKTVLQRLKFPLQPVVPQEFITYLAWWCDQRHPGEIEVAATFLCMSGLMADKAMCDVYPSVMAAASVKNAVVLLGKKYLLSRLESCPMYKMAEKKSTSMSTTCSLLRRAVRAVAAPIYEYKSPYEHYGLPPSYIAQRIITSANEISLLEVKNNNGILKHS